MKKIVLKAAASLLVAVTAFIYIITSTTDEVTPDSSPTEEAAAAETVSYEDITEESVQQEEVTEEYGEPADEDPLGQLDSEPPATFVHKPKKPKPVETAAKPEQQTYASPVPVKTTTEKNATTPTDSAKAVPLTGTGTGERQECIDSRCKHSVILSAGAGMSAADTSNALVFQGTSLSEGFNLEDSFMAELAYMYRVNDNLGIEPFISYSAEEKKLVSGFDSYALEHAVFAAGGNVLGMAPFNNLDFYVLAGVMYVYNKFDYSSRLNSFNESNHSFGIQGGMGVDYLFGGKIRAGLRYVYRYNKPSYSGSDPNLSKYIITARIGLDF